MLSCFLRFGLVSSSVVATRKGTVSLLCQVVWAGEALALPFCETWSSPPPQSTGAVSRCFNLCAVLVRILRPWRTGRTDSTLIGQIRQITSCNCGTLAACHVL